MARRKTQKRPERTASREQGGHKDKQHKAPRPRAPGTGNQRKPETAGAETTMERNRKQIGAPSDENKAPKKGDGGGGQQPPESSQHRGGTHKQGESARRAENRKAHKGKTNSAKAQGTRGRTPAKARDNGGARKKRAPKGSDENREARKGGRGGSSHQGATNDRAVNTNEAREQGEPRGGRPKKTNSTQRQSPGHPGPKQRKARDQGGVKKNDRPGGGEERKTKRQGTRHPGPGTQGSKRQRGRAKKKRGGEGRGNKGGPTKDQKKGNPSPEGAEQDRKTEQPEEKVRRTETRPGGRPAQPSQKGGAAIPRTGASEDKWQPHAPDWIVRPGPSRRNCRPPDWSIQGPAAVDAPRTGEP